MIIRSLTKMIFTASKFVLDSRYHSTCVKLFNIILKNVNNKMNIYAKSVLNLNPYLLRILFVIAS